MALDEALMESAAAGGATAGPPSPGTITLRLYRWNPPALSFGRNQLARERYDPRAARERGIDIVRRPTGGRSVYHDRELTYSVTAPADMWVGSKPAICGSTGPSRPGWRPWASPVRLSPGRAGAGPPRPVRGRASRIRCLAS